MCEMLFQQQIVCMFIKGTRTANYEWLTHKLKLISRVQHLLGSAEFSCDLSCICLKSHNFGVDLSAENAVQTAVHIACCKLLKSLHC